MAKISITKKELDKIIQEEAVKFKKALTLKNELKKIQAEIKQLNEVQAGPPMSAQANGGVHAGQKTPKFSTKKGNPYLKMEDNEEEVLDTVDTDTDMDMTDTEIPAEVGADVDSDTVSKADIWQAIEDLKMALNLHAGENTEDTEEVSDTETLETPEEETAEETEEVPAEENGEENTESEDDEVFEFEEKEIAENLEGPIEGGSPVQHAAEDTVNDNMSKSKHPEQAGTLMETEKKRMSVLAGIVKG